MAYEEQYELPDNQGQDSARPVPSNKSDPMVAKTLQRSFIGTIEDVPAGTIKNALVKVNVTDEKIQEIATQVEAVLVQWTGTGTKEQYDLVKRTRLDMRPLRVAVQKAAKEGREEANRVRQLWIDAEHAVTDPLIELESRLEGKEKQFEEEQARLAEEAARVERERVLGLFKQLQDVEWRGNELIVAQMTPEQFDAELKAATAQYEELQALRKAEADRIEREAREAAELAEKNRAEAVRLAEEGARQRAAAEQIERDKAEAEAQRQKALAEVEEARQSALAEVAEAKAKAEAEAQAAKNLAAAEESARQRALDEQKAAAEAAEVKRQADLELERQRALAAPDREKVSAWADKIEAVLKEAPLSLGPNLSTVVVGIHRDISLAVDALKAAAQ